METLLVTAENLAYLLWREVEVKTHNVGVFDMIYIVVNVC